MKHKTAPIKEIAADFYMITLPMPFRLGHVNVYLVVHHGKATLFDTGLNIAESRTELKDALESLNLSLADIDRIFITHFHADHCGASASIKEASSAVIHMSAASHTQISRMKEMNGVIERTDSYLRSHGLPEKTIGFIDKFFILFKKVTDPFEADEIVAPHDTFNAGKRSFEAILTPGHANGHLCFYFRDEGILLSGDHVLPDITPNLGPDLFDPAFHPLEEFLSSLRRIRDLPVSSVCPAHGAPFPNLARRVDEILEHHRVRKDLVLQSVRRKSKDTFSVALEVFENNLNEFDKFLALNETLVHLMELEKEGFVSRKGGESRIIRWSA